MWSDPSRSPALQTALEPLDATFEGDSPQDAIDAPSELDAAEEPRRPAERRGAGQPGQLQILDERVIRVLGEGATSIAFEVRATAS